MSKFNYDLLYFKVRYRIEDRINKLCWYIASRGGVAFKVDYDQRVIYINGVFYRWGIRNFYDDKSNVVTPIYGGNSILDLYKMLVK